MATATSDRAGYIQLHRSIIDSRLWSYSDATFRVAVYLLLECNHKPGFVRGAEIDRGQTVRSLSRISEDCKLSRKSVRCAMENLKKIEFLKWDEPFGAQQGHRITVCKYDTYQAKENGKGTVRAHEGNNEGNNEGNTNNNEENDNNEKTHNGAGVFNPQNPIQSPVAEISGTADGISKDQFAACWANIRNNPPSFSIIKYAGLWVQRMIDYGTTVEDIREGFNLYPKMHGKVGVPALQDPRKMGEDWLNRLIDAHDRLVKRGEL